MAALRKRAKRFFPISTAGGYRGVLEDSQAALSLTRLKCNKKAMASNGLYAPLKSVLYEVNVVSLCA